MTTVALQRAQPQAPAGRATHRVRLVGICVALLALALKQAPSQLVGDTKLDLSVDPVRFLSRALHLWDPSGDFGQTQNQSYGYLFPMGPFFVVGHAVGLPAWVVQRLWWGTLMCLAFLGVVKLAERLELGDPFSRLVGGVAFALSPRVLSTLGPISVETLPYCLSPWVLVPLVTGAREGSTRRAAARSGVAVLCMGAVNAAAVLAALPPAALYLLTRQRGPRRRSLQRWWVASVLLATTWWVVPLLLLGRYSPPFLDYIESASVTTSVTSLVEVLRGTSDWVAYVGGTRGPSWVTGAALVTTPVFIAYTAVVAAVGLVGLLRRDLAERWWLTCCLLLGVAAVTAGHVGSLTGPLAGQERQLLDGVLAPFRNVHKFEVDVRLPLVLGLVHLVSQVGRARRPGPDRGPLAVRVAVVAAVLGAALPALSVGLAPRAPFTDVPGYWQQTADWLAQRDAQGSALLLPASRFPDYLWGSSNDEPMQVLARSRWAVRNAVPLTPPGTIRFLDAVEQRLATGTPSPGLADDLARAGVRYLVVRNDLDRASTGSARPLLVHTALVGSPGIDRVATFGGLVGGGNASGYVDEALDVPYPAVEVYEVARPTPRAQLAPLSSALQVQGGPEALLALADRGVLGGRPVLLAGQSPQLPGLGAPVLTDGLRRRDVSFGAPVDVNSSATLTADEPFRADVPAHDYLAPGWATATARLVGARSVEASSSASDARAYGGAQREHQPYAAVDGDPSTSWRSDVGADLRTARWALHLDGPRSATGLVLRFDVGFGLARPSRVTVATDSQSVTVDVPGDGRPVPVRGLDAATTSLTVRTAAVRGTGLGYLGLADVALPGLTVSRTLDLPHLGGTPVIALSADGSGRPDCYRLLEEHLCSRSVGRAGEDDLVLDRTLHLDAAADYRLSGTAVARPGPRLDALLDAGSPVTVTASSRAVASPVGRPGSVVDGDLGTGWRAASGDEDPSLTLRWARPERLTGLRLQVSASLAATRPVRVRLESASGTRTAAVGRGGDVSFAPLVARQVVVHLEAGPPATTLDPVLLVTSLLPVGVSELTVHGAPTSAPRTEALPVPCGAGPDVAVGTTVVRTRLALTRTAALDLRPVPLVPCGRDTVRLGDGSRLVAASTALARVQGLTLCPASGCPAAQAATALAPQAWGVTHRRLPLPARTQPSLLTVHENTNPGWVATLAGRRLTPVTVDGWQQGWVVPAGAAGTVALEFGPDSGFRRGLLAGAAAVLLLLALALRRGRGPGAPAVGARPGGLPMTALLLLVLALVGGAPAVGAAAVLGLVLSGRRRELLGPVAGAALVAAGLLLAREPSPGSLAGVTATAPQALCVVALAAVWAGLLPARRSFRARAGRSTTT